MLTPVIRGFPPLASEHARILILGSMPGVASLAAHEYYAHPRNAFWPIMGELLGFSAQLPYPQRCAELLQAGIAVWDVLQYCQRQGSLDTAIEPDSLVANDLAGFLSRHPLIDHVFFNGSAAATLFRRHVASTASLPPLQLSRLPSTSPAHAAAGFAEKLAAWQAIRVVLDAKRAD